MTLESTQETLFLSEEERLKSLEGLLIVFAFYGVANTIVIYDFLLNLGLEVEHIWKAEWTFGKILYLLVRYQPMLELIPLMYYRFMDSSSASRCRAVYAALAWLCVIGIAMAEVLLTLRIRAVCQKTRRLTVTLSTAFVALLSILVTCLILHMQAIQYIDLDPHDVHCVITGKRWYIASAWVATLVYDAGVFALLLVQAFSSPLARISDSSRLSRTLYRDGLIYYIYIFVLTAVNVVVVLALPFNYVNLFTELDRVMYSILTCRAILHIRADARARQNLSVLEQEVEDSIQFAFRDLEDSVASDSPSSP